MMMIMIIIMTMMMRWVEWALRATPHQPVTAQPVAKDSSSRASVPSAESALQMIECDRLTVASDAVWDPGSLSLSLPNNQKA